MPVYFWTDSNIVIHWLNKDISSLKPFVANRVSTILTSTKVEEWRHVAGIENPADLVSRGCSTERLKTDQLWWEGPLWLQQKQEFWPNIRDRDMSYTEILAEKAETKVHLILNNTNYNSLVLFTAKSNGMQLLPLTERIGTLNKLLRSTAFVFRYLSDLRSSAKLYKLSKIRTYKQYPASYESIPALSPVERELALKYWIRITQKTFFFD